MLRIATCLLALHHASIHFTVFSLCITLLQLLLLSAALVLLIVGSTVSLLLGEHVCSWLLSVVQLVLNFGVGLSVWIKIIVEEGCIYFRCSSI